MANIDIDTIRDRPLSFIEQHSQIWRGRRWISLIASVMLAMPVREISPHWQVPWLRLLTQGITAVPKRETINITISVTDHYSNIYLRRIITI